MAKNERVWAEVIDAPRVHRVKWVAIVLSLGILVGLIAWGTPVASDLFEFVAKRIHFITSE